MIAVHYAVCSEQRGKPVVRAIVETRQEADRRLEELRRGDGHDVTIAYWLAELGPESEAWRTSASQPAREK